MNITPFIYNDIAIQESCWIDGKPYFTRRAIGEFLEYKHPQKAIDNIIERNPYIDNPRWSVTLNLRATDGKKYATKAYDPISFQLITFESHRPKAIRYKITVAKLVWALMTGNLKPSKWSQKGDLVSAARQILSLPHGRKRGALIRDLADRDGVSLQTAYRRIQMATGKKLKTTKGKAIRRSDKGSTIYPEEKEQVLLYIKEHPDSGGAAIRKALCLTVSADRINVWIRETCLRAYTHRQAKLK